MIISLMGNEGAGKSTVAQMLSDRLGMKRYYMGAIRRQKAAGHGMTLDEYNKLGETDPTTDTEVDEYLTNLGKTGNNFIIESRTAWHFIPHSFKIILTVEPREGARRVLEDLNKTDRNETKYQTLEEAVEGLRKRKESDFLRFQKFYQIDIFNLGNYNLVIDTTSLSPDEVVRKIVEGLTKND